MTDIASCSTPVAVAIPGRCGCGEQNPADVNRCARCNKWLTGNTEQLRHGGRRRALTLQEARQSELYQDWDKDLGGVDVLPAAKREVLTRVVGASQIAESAAKYLANTRCRRTNPRVLKAIEVYFAAMDTVMRGASVIGLERRTKTRCMSSASASATAR